MPDTVDQTIHPVVKGMRRGVTIDSAGSAVALGPVGKAGPPTLRFSEKRPSHRIAM